MALPSPLGAVPGALAMIDRPQQHQPDSESNQDDEKRDDRHSGNEQFQHDFLSRVLR
jgi:hypothetical protein